MNEKGPVIEIFIGRDGDRWRMRFAPASWRPGMLRSWMNDGGEIFPVARPDADDLAQFMWLSDSPFECRQTVDGGLEIRAEGRSAVTLLVWLDELVRSAPTLPR